MVLAPLAVAADLTARGITVPASMDADTLLVSASEAVRDAAGVPISQLTSTVTLEAPRSQWLSLPAPVVSVDTVTVDGAAVTDWRLMGADLWRPCYWRTGDPVSVVVTFTHGLALVPADIVDLVCSLVAAAAQSEGYAATNGLQSVKLDDASETYTTGDEAVTGPMELPESTRNWLRRRFSGGVSTTGVRE